MRLRVPLFVMIAWVSWSVAHASDLQRLSWVVDGVTREALVHVPAHTPPAGLPLVLVYHGHGGSMTQAARSMPFHEKWPEALVVYPQGLPTVGQLTDKAGRRAGWQGTAGVEGDRDLTFFDVMLADLRTRYRVDERRIYATGHSTAGASPTCCGRNAGTPLRRWLRHRPCWRAVTRNLNPSRCCMWVVRRTGW